MEKNNFIVDLIASLKKGQSKKQINSDIKNLGEIKIPFVGKLDNPKTRKQIKNDIKSLGDIYIPLIGKLSSKSKTVSQIKKDLAGVEIPVDLTGKVNKKGIVTSVQQATQQAQAVANKNKIKYDASFNIKKTKLLADIQYFAQQNSKMMKDANMASKYNTLLDNAKLATSNKEIRNLRMQLSAMRSELRANNLAGLTLGDTLKKTFKRAMELFSGTGFVMLLSQQLRQAWQESLNLDKAFTDLVKVQSNLTRGDYPQYLEQCTRKAKELATTQQALIEGATEFSKSGYDLTTSNKLTEQSTILSNVGDMSASDSAKAIISGVQAYDVVDGYDDVIDKASALIDKFNEIGNTASITTAEVAQGVQSVGSVFADANTSVDEFIALLAAGNRQYQDADALALGLRTAALRIRGCKVELEQMGEETDGVYTSASKLAEKIEGLTNINGNGGVKILEADGETFRSIYDIFLDISKVYKDMSDVDQSALLELISGKHRASAISATLNNMTEAQEIYKRSLESAGSAQREYDKYLESSLASLNTFKANMIETYQGVFNGGTTKAILDAGSSVLEFANSLGLVESTLKSFIAIGAVKALTTLSTAFKASTLQASNFGKALQFSNSIPNGNLSQRFTMLKNIAIASKSLNDAQLKLVLSNKALSNEDRIRVMRLMGMEKSLAQAKLAEYGLTQATKAQSTAQKAATINTFSFSAAVKGLGMNLKLAFMSNPVGISIMALSTIIGAVSSKVSEYNEKLRETRQANMDAATSAKEKADSLRDLYVQYENLSGITNRTSSQEEQFKQVVIDITKALGDKASALEGLTAGQNDYTEALKEATKAELESQYATAKIGAKAAEEELKDKTYDFWTGSQITILQNEQMAGVKEHMAALEAVKDILAEYEDIGMQGDMVVTQWEPVNWDENRNDMMAVVEYYNALVEARNRLATADNADFLMSSDIYEDINTTINDLTESVEKYTEQQYNALKLNYEWQNGVPSTEEEFRKMEESILNASGAGKEFQEILKGYLAEDFSTFSESATKNIGDLSGAVENATQLSSDIKSFSEAWNAEDFSKAKDELLALAEAGRLTPETLQSTEEYNKLLEQTGMSAEEAAKKINSMTDASTQLQSMSSQISKMSDMLADKKNKKTASADDLASFDVEVRGLESWKEFERLMGDSNSTLEECQKAANDLATEWVNNGNYLANLTDENKDYYITQLNNMGIENAEAIVTDALTQKKNDLALATQFAEEKSKDLSKATVDEITKFADEHKMAGEARNALYRLALAKKGVSAATLTFDGDIANIKNFVESISGAAYALAEMEAIKKNPSAYVPSEVKQKILDQARTEVSNAVNTPVEVDINLKDTGSSGYKPTSTGKSKSGGSGSSKSDTKQTIDWISRLLDVLQKKIDATKAKFENLFTLKSKKNNLNTQIKQTQTLLNATTIAANKYLEKANSIRLSDSLKKKVQNGSYDISEYSSDTADKISKYQDYLNKYNELIQQTDELKTNIRELNSQSIQLDLDNANAKKDRYDALIENTTSVKTKVSYLKKQYKCIEDIYKYEIDLAELEKDTLKVKQLEIEKEKELRENTIAQHQAKVDQAQSYLDLYSSKIESAITASSKNKLEKEKIKYIKQSYDYQIKIAKEENDTLKVSQLKVEKEKELLAVKKEILQNTLDQNEKEKELLDAKYQNATTAKDKNKIIDKRSKLDNKDVTAYRDSYNDANKTLSSTSKSVNKTTSNAKSLSDSDRKKIDSYIKSGKVVPESLLKKVKAVDSNWYDTLVNYNNKYADRSSTLKAIKNSKVSKSTQDNLEKAINSGKTISNKTLGNVKKKDPALYKNLDEWNNEQKNRQNIIKKISSTKTLTSGDKKKIKSLVNGKKPISDSLLKKVASANPTLYAKLVKYNTDLEYRDDTKYNLNVAVEKDKTQKRQDTKEKFDNIDQEYSMKVGLTSNKVKAFQDQVSLLEAKGMEVGSRLYTKQMELNQVNINRLTKEYSDQMKELSNIEFGTEEWYAAQDAIFNTTSEINSLEIENANLQKSINQLKFDRFDDLLNKLNDIVDETDFLIDMLDSENFFDDNGKITDDGITAMGLNAQKYDVYLAEAQRYKEQMAELERDYQNGDVDPETYEAKMREYKNGQQDMIKSANDVKKSLISLVKEGLDAQNQALEESIQKQKELIEQKKKDSDFNKTITNQNKEIARLERQIAVTENDSSDENKKNLRELRSRLQELKDEQSETLYDRSVANQEEALDQMLEDAKSATESYLKDTDRVLIDTFGIVNTHTEQVSKNLEKISEDLGYDISTNITDAWKDGGKAVDTYANILQGSVPKINLQIESITTKWNEACKAAEKAAEAIVNTTEGKYTEHTTKGADSKVLNDIEWYINKNGVVPKNNPSSYSLLNQHIYDKTGKVIAEDKQAGLAKILGINGVGKDTSAEERAKILKELKLAGFSKGGVISELSNAIRLNGDTVLVSAKPGERMLTEQQNDYWEKWTQSLPNLMNLTDIIKPNVNIPTAIPTVNREQSPVYNIDSSITVEGVATNEIVKDMANVAKKQAENVISEINRRTYAKGVRWK